MRKTDKSMTELVRPHGEVPLFMLTPALQQIEHNLKFDFSMTGDDGKELEPVFGPGLTGLKNLGNRYVPREEHRNDTDIFCFQLLYGVCPASHFCASGIPETISRLSCGRALSNLYGCPSC